VPTPVYLATEAQEAD